MLMAFYVTLCEKTFQGLGIGGSCLPVSSDGNVTVMVKDPDVQVCHSYLSDCMSARKGMCTTCMWMYSVYQKYKKGNGTGVSIL